MKLTKEQALKELEAVINIGWERPLTHEESKIAFLNRDMGSCINDYIDMDQQMATPEGLPERFIYTCNSSNATYEIVKLQKMGYNVEVFLHEFKTVSLFTKEEYEQLVIRMWCTK